MFQQRKSGHYILHAKRNSWGLYAGILIQGLMVPHNSYACINTSKFFLIMTKDFWQFRFCQIHKLEFYFQLDAFYLFRPPKSSVAG
ncbi:hypothetical protein BDA96_10G344500 [Sorghum bicolor]|uniref:Uncharacterized protein n=2 Tax=Sorghum bicolor TaxID=4558 RepID=A0A921U351_SORBI|nr:hypothetical protein BDA96_10G344500 [Sorghum bicolor]OQU77113.1 hypothetical protein SORBI_3010G267450 [Sorghum bicolor]